MTVQASLIYLPVKCLQVVGREDVDVAVAGDLRYHIGLHGCETCCYFFQKQRDVIEKKKKKKKKVKANTPWRSSRWPWCLRP